MTCRTLLSLLWAWDSALPVPASGSGKSLIAHILSGEFLMLSTFLFRPRAQKPGLIFI